MRAVAECDLAGFGIEQEKLGFRWRWRRLPGGKSRVGNGDFRARADQVADTGAQTLTSP